MQIPATRPKAHARLAALAQAQDWPEALRFARAMLKRWPGDLGGLELAAVAAMRLGQPADAAKFYKQLCLVQPALGELQTAYADALMASGDLVGAQAVLTRRLAKGPGDAKAQFLLGRVQACRGLIAESVAAFRLAAQLQPDLVEAWYQLGVVCELGRQLDEAEFALAQAVALRPQWVAALSGMASVLLNLQRPAEALGWAERALALAPEFEEARLNLGCALQGLGRYTEALPVYRELGLKLESISGIRAAFNAGTICSDIGREGEALQWFEQVLTHRPDYGRARFARGLIYLGNGQLAEGWADYEARLQAEMGEHQTSTEPFPLWTDQSLEGKHLLVCAEQGFGDLLQFCRFISQLRSLGTASIGLRCAQSVARLLASLPDVDQIVTSLSIHAALEWDYAVPVMSLPHRVGLTALSELDGSAYLQPSGEAVSHWRDRLAGRALGVVWRGNSGHYNDRHRSLPSPEILAPLAAVPDFIWVSLQRDARQDELAAAAVAGLPLFNPAAELTDFADTAGLVCALDLVITVDTAVAHLAGALGRPCWVLLPFVGCDWRWLKDRDDSPWYDSVRLYRQPQEGDWASVIAAVKRDLAALG